MKAVFDKYAGFETPTGAVVAGYTTTHIILAVKTNNVKEGFRKVDKNTVIADEFTDKAYRYVYCDESYLNALTNDKPIVT